MVHLRKLALVLGVLLLGFTWLSTEVTAPNERSRIYLAVSAVDHQTLSIDEAIDRFGFVYDRAEHDGHTYSDKPPGSSLLAAGLYGLSRLATEPGDWTIEALLLLMRFGLMIPLTVAGLLLLRRTLRLFDLDETVVDLASVGWLVATPVLHYGQAFFGHQIVAVCLLGAVYCLLQPDRTLKHFAFAGACAGLAGMTEYQAIIPAFLLGLWVVIDEATENPLGIAAFFGAAVPFAAMLFAYHTAAFGGPLQLSYHHLVDPSLVERHTEGIGGVTLPTWEAFFGGFLSLHRGLFVTAPLVLIAAVGFGPMARRIGRRRAVFVGLILAAYCFFVASSNNWDAGWSYGPRLLVPILAIAFIPVGFGLDRIRRHPVGVPLALTAFFAGLVSNAAMKITFFEVPPSSTNPLLDVALVSLADGAIAHNWATAVGLSPGIAVGWVAVTAAVIAAVVAWAYAGRHRPEALPVAVVLTAVFFAFIYAVGPSWTDAQFDRFDGTKQDVLLVDD